MAASNEQVKSRATTSAAAREGSARRRARREALTAYVFVAPFLLGFLLFTAFPMLFSLGISFFEWDVTRAPRWRGLGNYAAMRDDPVLHIAVTNTLLYVLVSVPLSLASSFGLALLLSLDLRGAPLWRTLVYLPTVTPAVASTVLWIWIFNSDFGLLNSLLAALGLPKLSWLYDPRLTKVVLVTLSLWQSGLGALVLLAGLRQLPPELYEAARIDGATAYQRLWRITVPLLSPALFFQLIVSTIAALQLFTQVYVLAGHNPNSPGGPANSLMFYVLYLYVQAFRYFELGYASALAWVLFAITAVLALVLFRAGERRSDDTRA